MKKEKSPEQGCSCKKCGASIDPADEKCPNGHVLKDVGRHYKVILKESIGLSDSIGKKYKLPSPIPLTFAKYDGFTQKISTLQKNLKGYHQTTKYKLLIAEYCLNLLLEYYNNNIAFAAGLTGFLVQTKSALDSLSEEINIYYSLNLIKPKSKRVTDIKKLIKIKNLTKLSIKNSNLAQILRFNLISAGNWFSEFITFRNQEGVHRTRSPRHIIMGTPANDIQIGGKEVARYCVDILNKINKIIEDCYHSMI